MSFTTPNSPTFGGGSNASSHHHHRHHHHYHHHYHHINNHHTKRRWSEIEDKILKEAVSRHGVNQWDGVARLIWTKSADECRARWAELVPVLHDNLAEEAAALMAADPPPSSPPYYSSFDDEGREEEEQQQHQRHRRRERRREGAKTEGAPPSPTQDGTATGSSGTSARIRRNTEPSQARRTLSQRRAWRAPHPLMVPSSPPPVPQLVSASTSTTTSRSFSFGFGFSFGSPGILSPRGRQSRSPGSSRDVSRDVSPTRVIVPCAPESEKRIRQT
ncbi:hypothetical protein F5X99DRAFT_414152 [Biscogniauxia marginata]|nr:hypothetical protein F5X99DRAFT_414152 [Biscogniauxia marginata]